MAETKALEVRVEQKLGLLNWNFEELNQQLDSQLEKYRGMTFTDDQMPEAKKTRAALNKVAKEINDRKLAVKREFCAPYEQFEDQAKILIGKIKQVSGEIDQQVKDYEESKKQKKATADRGLVVRKREADHQAGANLGSALAQYNIWRRLEA